MNFSQAIVSGFRKWKTFSGRSSRSEFWYWTLFIILIDGATRIFDQSVLQIPFSSDHSIPHLIFVLIVFFPSLAVSVRRLHDVNRSGWWFLLGLTIIGYIPLLFWYADPGMEEDNEYGGNPDPIFVIRKGLYKRTAIIFLPVAFIICAIIYASTPSKDMTAALVKVIICATNCFSSPSKNIALPASKDVKEMKGDDTAREAVMETEVIDQIDRCWERPKHLRKEQEIPVEISLTINPDRTIKEAHVVDTARYANDKNFKAIADSALQALKKPECKQLNLLSGLYDDWHHAVFTFDPRDAGAHIPKN